MRIGIIGLGYVGLPIAVEFAEAGHDVVGYDTDSAKVERLRRSESWIEDVPSARLRAVVERFAATNEAEAIGGCDAVMICVPTPLRDRTEPDLSHLVDAARSLSRVLREGQLVALESTTYPGTTRDRLRPILEESGLAAGRDFNLAFSPERIDPGRSDHTLRNTPKLVAGLTDACRARAVAVYREVCDDVVEASALEVAETAKLLENVFRSVNIALVNELAVLCDRMGVDVWEVVEAAATKPFGFMRFDPGPGMGGHCLPVDPFYLAFKAREHDMSAEFIELAGKINRDQPYYCVDRIQRALNAAGKAVNGSRIAILGVAYKGGVGDLRESPAIKIIALLRELGGDVVYSDPYVSSLAEAGLESAPLEEALAGCDCACVVTAHPGVDYGAVARSAPLVVDFRGVTRGISAPSVVRL